MGASHGILKVYWWKHFGELKGIPMVEVELWEC